jgi:hypothetical protein
MIGHAHKNITHEINNMITTKGTLNSDAIAYQNGKRLSDGDGDVSVIMLHRLNMS